MTTYRTKNRVVSRPWATRRAGGFIIWRESLLSVLRMGPVVEINGLKVGARHLTKLLDTMPVNDFLIKSDGERLDIEAVTRVFRPDDAGHTRCHFRLQSSQKNKLSLVDGDQLPKKMVPVVVVRPRYYTKGRS